MPGYAKRTDGNQREIVDALRRIGCSVLDLSRFGESVPDLLVARARYTVLMEVKMPGEGPSDAQLEWHRHWHGDVVVVTSVDEAIAVMNVRR